MELCAESTVKKWPEDPFDTFLNIGCNVLGGRFSEPFGAETLAQEPERVLPNEVGNGIMNGHDVRRKVVPTVLEPFKVFGAEVGVVAAGNDVPAAYADATVPVSGNGLFAFAEKLIDGGEKNVGGLLVKSHVLAAHKTDGAVLAAVAFLHKLGENFETGGGDIALKVFGKTLGY